jgi:septal ring factor EnvC (AmiA/AmiB activator)
MQKLRDIFDKRVSIEEELKSTKEELGRIRQERDQLAEKLEDARRLVGSLNSRLMKLHALDRVDESSFW